MNKLSHFKRKIVATPIAMQISKQVSIATPIATQSPLIRGTINQSKSEVSTLTSEVKLSLRHSTLIENKTKVPLVRGQAAGLGVALDYNKKLQPRSHKMSREMTKSEQKIWFEVLAEKKLLGYKFIKQKIIDNYILDFYCPKLMLAIEIDGESHNTKQEYDKTRDNFLKVCGIEVLRFTNQDVLGNLAGVREYLIRFVDKNIQAELIEI